MEHTEFYFNSSNDSFYEALDRFSQFFISPLFTKSCTDREIQVFFLFSLLKIFKKAVHSEFEMILTSDPWRSIQLFRSLADKSSLLNRFGCGSLDTLKCDKLEERLLEFNKKYYSSNLMKLCIYSSSPIETLEKWVRELFSPIKNLSTPQRDPSLFPSPFTKSQNMRKMVEIVPIKDKDILEFVWVLEGDLRKFYKTKPEDLIGHLFGDEGKNSLLSLLKEEDLANALTQNAEYELESFTTFFITVELTKKGFERYLDVCELVFSYLKMMMNKSEEEWKELFNELKKINEINFLFCEKTREIEYVSKLVGNMFVYPEKDILAGETLLEIFDWNIIKNVLSSFSLDNMFIFFFSKKFEGKTQFSEKYFKTAYNIYEIPQTIAEKFLTPNIQNIVKCDKILDFPPKNLFIPENFQIPTEKDFFWVNPIKIQESNISTLWLKQGNQFNLPKGAINLKIYFGE